MASATWRPGDARVRSTIDYRDYVGSFVRGRVLAREMKPVGESYWPDLHDSAQLLIGVLLGWRRAAKSKGARG